VYLAVRSGHYDIVEFLLRAGCSIDFKGYKSTPMHCAAYYGHYNIIPLLLMYGMPINIKNCFGSLPIEEAANPEI
jgi:ankyrin repeat protein